MKVYIVTSASGFPADEPARAGFKETAARPFLWRDNALQLVPAKLLLHDGQAHEILHIPLGQRDALVLLKEMP